MTVPSTMYILFLLAICVFSILLNRRFHSLLLLLASCSIFGLFVLVQIAAFVVLVVMLGAKFPPVDIAVRVVAILIALGINSRDHNGVFKLVWVIVILIIPIPGLLFYVLNNFSSSKHKT